MTRESYDVLVTGAEERQGLAVVRSLGRRGLRVLACGLGDGAIGFRSRFAASTAQYPSPQEDTGSFARRIVDLVGRYDIGVVMPAVESTVVALDAHRELFSDDTIVALPKRDVLATALDKRATYGVCERLGISAPRSCYPASAEEGLAFAKTVGYPIVMKPRAQAAYRDSGGDLGFKVRYALGEKQFASALERFEDTFPILQEYCAGDGVAHSFLVANGSIRGLYQHRRLREYPLTGGVASVIESEPVDRQLLDWTQRFVSDVGWDGIAQVEYRHDKATGRRALIEVNGRFWAPLSGSVRFGLDFPYALYEYLVNGDESTLPEGCSPGQRSRYLRGDLVALEGYLRGDVTEGLRPLPGKGRAVWQVFRDFGPGIRGDVWDWNDRAPAWREAALLFGRYTARLRRKIRGTR